MARLDRRMSSEADTTSPRTAHSLCTALRSAWQCRGKRGRTQRQGACHPPALCVVGVVQSTAPAPQCSAHTCSRSRRRPHSSSKARPKSDCSSCHIWVRVTMDVRLSIDVFNGEHRCHDYRSSSSLNSVVSAVPNLQVGRFASIIGLIRRDLLFPYLSH